MEPPGTGRVRTLEPQQPEPSRPPRHPGLRWVPAAVATVAVVAVVGLAGRLAEGNIPSTVSTSPDSTLPSTPDRQATLADLVPGIGVDPTVVYQRPSMIGSVTWGRTQSGPGEAFTTGHNGWEVTGSFDRGGSTLALSVWDRNTPTLWAGTPPTVSPLAPGTGGWAWHDSKVLLLGWTARAVGETGPHLYTARISGTGEPQQVTDHGPVPAGARLAGWGDWGFAVNIAPPPHLQLGDAAEERPLGVLMTRILDPDGTARATVLAETLATGATGALVMRSSEQSYTRALELSDPRSLDLPDVTPVALATVDGYPAPLTPEVVVVQSDLSRVLHVFAGADELASYHFTPDGEVVTQGTSWRGMYTGLYHVRFGATTTVTASTVAGADIALGFDRSGRWLILTDTATDTLFFHDWERDETFPVPFDLGRVVAVSS